MRAAAAEISVAHCTPNLCSILFHSLSLSPPFSIHFLDTRQTNKKQDPFIFSFAFQPPSSPNKKKRKKKENNLSGVLCAALSS